MDVPKFASNSGESTVHCPFLAEILINAQVFVLCVTNNGRCCPIFSETLLCRLRVTSPFSRKQFILPTSEFTNVGLEAGENAASLSQKFFPPTFNFTNLALQTARFSQEALPDIKFAFLAQCRGNVAHFLQAIFLAHRFGTLGSRCSPTCFLNFVLANILGSKQGKAILPNMLM